MKKITLLFAITSSLFASSQKNYTKISTSKINTERVNVSENFIKEYYKKCENKDYSQFAGFILDKRLERKLFDDYEKKCEEVNQSGKINTVKLNSVYIKDYTKNSDPIELIVFDADFEKSKDLKYINVWIYRDQNVINGILISEEKPFVKSKN
ncbi:hypothetical protein [Chryseobacterium balustinum]|jgi:hypothetical protein|uniref:DUF3828 domain-containing protein n=1 Tax=Chryseobacterium balustinum TaxID=246 RepID=A0AAX2IQW8_9FLAO|nr:hypothetical protein [Chryseobacterium balustinum]AZB29233.1 hypothetical protein EB354_08190 [Chryseobacterium balustinum]SKB69936.1 hypothetical protein SAMN05421800_106124 [Chryseobacterium balustinum]SQA91498.1 Uncharacterised protein [Chryseobacterium balustinum]